MGKEDDRAELDRLMASFKGEVKRESAVPVVKRKYRGSKTGVAESRRSIEAAESQMRTPTGAGLEGLGGMQRYKETDYDAKHGPSDGAHHAFQMPKDKRSRGFLEMYMSEESRDDVVGRQSDSPEWTRRFKSAAKSGAHCGD